MQAAADDDHVIALCRLLELQEFLCRGHHRSCAELSLNARSKRSRYRISMYWRKNNKPSVAAVDNWGQKFAYE
jgi:hypothetical protein